MLDNQTINKLIGVIESYQAPDILMNTLMNDDAREKMFKDFFNYETDLSYDWFTNYFQEEHGDRSSLKQDYTPDCLTDLMQKLSEGNESYRDVCSGCGGLTIKTWNSNKKAEFVCEEFSTRAIPFLLFNLSIRKIKATVFQRDVLTMETVKSFRIDEGRITSCEQIDTNQDVSISNPPYSLKFDDVESYQNDKRYQYGIPPKKAADYCFAQHSLFYAKQKAYLILPHGVLFRGNREGQIREKMIRNNVIESVIGLPVNMFLNTGIPVMILVLSKHKNDNSILFIDASNSYEKNGKQNKMLPSDIERCIEAYKNRSDIEKYSHLASFQEIYDNDFNLNIPRYVSTLEHENAPDLVKTIEEYNDIKDQIRETEKKLFDMVDQLTGTTAESENYLKIVKDKYRKETETKMKDIKEFEQIGMKL